jgi:hypothetical protein
MLRRRVRRIAFAGVWAAAIVAAHLPGASWAQAAAPLAPGADDAQKEEYLKALFVEASALFDQKRLTEACARFAELHQLDARPIFLFNLALCHEEAGDLAAALDANERIAVNELPPELGAAVREAVERLQQKVPSVSFQPPPPAGTTVKIDGQILLDLERPQRLNAGRHRLEAMADGKRSFFRVFELAPPERLEIAIPSLDPEQGLAEPSIPPGAGSDGPFTTAPVRSAMPRPNALDAARPEATSSPAWAPWALMGGGAALLTSGLVTGLRTQAMEGAYQDKCRNPPRPEEECEQDKERVENMALATDILWPLGLAALVTGAIWFVLDPNDSASGSSRTPHRPTTSALNIGCSRQGCRLEVFSRF